MNNQLALNGSASNPPPQPPPPSPMFQTERSLTTPVNFQQSNAINVFMMGQGESTVNLGYFPPGGVAAGAGPSAAGFGNAWGPWGTAVGSFQTNQPAGMGPMSFPQPQDHQCFPGPAAPAGTQSGYVKDLGGMMSNSPATNGNGKANGYPSPTSSNW